MIYNIYNIRYSAEQTKTTFLKNILTYLSSTVLLKK